MSLKTKINCMLGKHDLDPTTERVISVSQGQISADGRRASWSSDYAVWEQRVLSECRYCNTTTERPVQ